MITDSNNKAITPKQYAQDQIMDAISVKLGYWTERDDYKDMTESERKKVNEQMWKLANRVAKMMGYDEAWSG